MATENFTTYTEVDVNNKLTVTASKAEAVDADGDEDVYLYKDKTADHFDALDIDFEIYAASTSENNATCGMAIANTIGTMNAFASTDLIASFYNASGAFRLYLRRAWEVPNDYYDGSSNTLYYCTLERAAGNDTVSLKIYSDSGRTNLLDTLAVAGFGTVKWQYVYGFLNRNVAAGGRDFDGYVQNLDLQEGVTQVVGGGAIAITATINLKSMVSVGAGSIAIAGALISVLTLFQAVGNGSVAIAGALGRLIKLAVGSGAISISGSLSSIKKIFQVVGSGAVTIVGSLVANISTIFHQAVGGGVVAITGTLLRIRDWIALTLKSRTVTLTVQSRSLSLSLQNRTLLLTLRRR